MQLSFWEWSIVFGYVCLTILGSLYFKRFITGVATFLVAGRKVRLFLLTSAGSSTEVGIIAVVMLSAEAYDRGPIALSFPILIVLTYFFTGFSGFCVFRLRKSNAITLGHYAEMRFGSKAFRVAAGVPLLIAGVSTIAMFPAVAGNFFTYFMGWPAETEVFGMAMRTPLLVSAILFVVILGYTLLSGSVGLVFSDFMQFAIIWISLFLITYYILQDISGQGAGAAAALSVLEKKDLDAIDIKKLQKKLREQNVMFEPDESIELPDQDTRTKFIF